MCLFWEEESFSLILQKKLQTKNPLLESIRYRLYLRCEILEFPKKAHFPKISFSPKIGTFPKISTPILASRKFAYYEWSKYSEVTGQTIEFSKIVSNY